MKLTKQLFIFTGLFVGINAILLVVLHKYFRIFFHQTVIFCQEMTKVVISGLPNNFGIFIILILSFVVLTSILKFSVVVINMWNLRKKINKNILDINDNYITINSVRPFAFCFGIIKPKIYVSKKLIQILSKRELRSVILHEKYHIQKHDTLTLLIATVFESLTPHLPLVKDIIRNYKIERELMADKSAILELGSSNDLISVLKKLLKYESQIDFAGIPAIAGIDTLEPRIKRLVNNEHFIKAFSYKNIIISLISTIFLVFLALIPVNTSEIHTVNSDSVILCLDKNMSSYYTL
jgi:bla regulator protein BlaR1